MQLHRKEGRLFSSGPSIEFNRANSFGGGAGKLEKIDDSARGKADREMKELFYGVFFSGSVVRQGDVYRLSVSIHLGHAAGSTGSAVRTCRFSFAISPENAWMEEYACMDDVIFNQEDLARFGISIKAKRYAIGDAPVESRIQLIQSEQGETETITVANESHWQNSHSHNATAESYGLVTGTIIIVSEVPQQCALKVQAFTKTETGFREVRFLYDPKTGRASEEFGQDFYGSVSPIIQTEPHTAHNVFLTAGTIIATSKVIFDAEQVARAGADWNREESLDNTLNGTAEDSEGNIGVTQVEIVDAVERAFRT